MKELISQEDLELFGRVLQNCVERYGSGCSTPGAIETPLLLVESLKVAREENAALKEELREWKANHEQMVRRCAILRERPDLPVDRIPAYEELVKLQNQVKDNPRLGLGRGIVDALAVVPQSKITYQLLRDCIRNARSRKDKTTDITFATSEMSCNDYLSGQGKCGIVIWCDRDILADAIKTVQARSGL